MKRRNSDLLKIAAVTAGAFVMARAAIERLTEYDVKNKTVLITGGSRGLGLVMAREFAHQGARIVICARDNDELARAHNDLISRGAQVFAIACDVTNQHQVNNMIETVEARFGEIDILVNNAGVIEVGPMELMKTEDYQEALQTHFWAPLYTTLAVLPSMRRRKAGRIVNISSIGGKLSVPHLLPYSASKFALAGFSQGLRAELAKDNITVTTIYPGLMRTGSPRNATFKGQHRAEYAWFSISDSLPVTSIQAERAARQIITACKRGKAEVVLTIQAKLAALFHGIFPGLTTDILSLVNRLLPGPGGIGSQRAKGADSQSALSPSWLTKLNEEAAARNNELIM